MGLLDSGDANIMEVTQNLLYAGFRKGQWNPDMMLLLAEPTAYMIMALAERAQIDYKVDDEPDIEDPEVEGDKRLQGFKSAMESKDIQKGRVPSGIIPKEIEAKLDQAPVESLLASKPTDETSLLAG
jgi:hypothetical protein